MSLRFKAGRTHIILDEFRRMDPRLQVLVLSIAGFCELHFEKGLVVTEIFRTEVQQRSYYPDRKYRPSVHQYGRGIDFGIRVYGAGELDSNNQGVRLPHSGFTDRELELLDEWYTTIISYDDERPDFDSLVHHNIGLGDHLHLQVNWRNATRIRSNVPTLLMLAQRVGVAL